MARAARSRSCPELSRLIDGEKDVLDVRKANNEADHVARHIKALLGRYWMDSALFETPRRSGAVGRIRHFLKHALWKLLRYQHDWCLFRQNTINVQTSYGLEFERQVREKQIADIERRIRKIETALTAAPDDAGQSAREAGRQ